MKKALILSGISWDTTLQRHHKIAKWLKKMGYDVTFVESIPSSKITISKCVSKIKSKFVKSSKIKNKKEVQVVNGGFLPPIPLFNIINNIKVQKLLKKIGTNYEVIVNYLPIYTTDVIISKIKYSILIYDCVRDFGNWGGYPQNLKKYEKKLKECSNFIMTDSFYLTEKNKGIQFLPSLTKEQYKVFSQEKNIKKIKKVVYFGQIDTHIDVEILKTIASYYELHIIGNSKISLHFKYIDHGFIENKQELAKEIMNCDAIIIPYKGNMDGVVPAKLIESLATKMPVFISSFYDSEKLKDYCYVYHTEKELLQMMKNFNKVSKANVEKLISFNIEEKQFERFKEVLLNEKKVVIK